MPKKRKYLQAKKDGRWKADILRVVTIKKAVYGYVYAKLYKQKKLNSKRAEIFGKKVIH